MEMNSLLAVPFCVHVQYDALSVHCTDPSSNQWSCQATCRL